MCGCSPHAKFPAHAPRQDGCGRRLKPARTGGTAMRRPLRWLAAASPLLLALSSTSPALGQKPGGILNISHFDSPASMSLHEEATAAAVRPMMGVFDNLVMYRQDVAQGGLQSIVPALSTGWNWSEDGTELTIPFRQPGQWHDGRQ